MNLLVGALLLSVAADISESMSAAHVKNKKQDVRNYGGDYGGNPFGEGNPFEGMGDDFTDSIDFICENFCPKSGGGDDQGNGEALMAEILKLKEELSAQTNTLNELVQAVNKPGPGVTDLVPLEYKPAYPVFHVQSDHGRYLFSLAQARSACEEDGGKLASYKQVLAAWERGLDLCQCGWIDEGYAVYPIQYPREGCVTKIGPGIRYNCDWQSTWNAWCFNKDIANKLP